MRDVFVMANDGTRLMPTTRYRARKLLSAGKAMIHKYFPFTIQLQYESEKNVQPIELCMDTGSEHIGISVKSEKHEYVHAQYDNLSDEKKKHQVRLMYRRTRRNWLRYRKPRFNNRRRNDGWLAPTVLHKKDNHVRLFQMYADVCPITSAALEVGQFDTAALQAAEEGRTLSGVDYQRGLRYQLANLREAVFVRDHWTCRICKKSISDGVILHAHHIVPRSAGGTNRLNNLLTVCHKCHTPKNHKPGGKLYGLEPLTGTFKDATFMNIVRWYIVNEIKALYPDIIIHHTYGFYTKAARRDLGQLPKTHANDAYAMGEFHPKHRHGETHYQKRRRNNRVLSKFYDAKYTDVRDGSKKSGSQLSCNRTNRRIPRNNPQNERRFRGHKVSNGRVSVRRKRYPINSGDIVCVGGKLMAVSGTAHYGEYVHFGNGAKDIKCCKVRVRKYASGWVLV